jgi:hypothetical protein
VDRAGEDVLADAGLASDEDGEVRRGDALEDANTSRILSERPTASPNDSRSVVRTSSGRPSSARKRMRVSPTVIVAPERRRPSLISTSPTRVPFVEPRSRKSHPSSVRRSSQ